jgi:Tfp pilus assembly protein PilV
MTIFRKNKNRSGLVLTEAMVSVALLGLAAIALGSIMTSAYQMTLFSRNYMIAQNLATEGIEAVVNIRDTNWLLSPDNKACWLRKIPSKTTGCTGTSIVAQDSNYRIERLSSTNNYWKLYTPASPAADLDLEDSYKTTTNNWFKLYTKALTPTDPSTQYVHSYGTVATPFYRSVKFTKVDLANNYAIYEVKVQWYEGKKVRTIKRTSIIYNYL